MVAPGALSTRSQSSRDENLIQVPHLRLLTIHFYFIYYRAGHDGRHSLSCTCRLQHTDKNYCFVTPFYTPMYCTCNKNRFQVYARPNTPSSPQIMPTSAPQFCLTVCWRQHFHISKIFCYLSCSTIFSVAYNIVASNHALTEAIEALSVRTGRAKSKRDVF